MPKFLTERTAVRIDYVFRLQHYYDHESQNFQVHLIYLDLYLNIDRSFQPINTYTKTNLIYQKKIIAQMGLLKKNLFIRSTRSKTTKYYRSKESNPPL